MVPPGHPTHTPSARFATENSIFHVPEATLGLGLAGGLSYALPRLLGGNQQLALCLSLTGMALEGPDLFFTQIATNYMTHRRLDMMTERLAEVRRRAVTLCFWPEVPQRIVSMFGCGSLVRNVTVTKSHHASPLPLISHRLPINRLTRTPSLSETKPRTVVRTQPLFKFC